MAPLSPNVGGPVLNLLLHPGAAGVTVLGEIILTLPVADDVEAQNELNEVRWESPAQLFLTSKWEITVQEGKASLLSGQRLKKKKIQSCVTLTLAPPCGDKEYAHGDARINEWMNK